MKKNMPLILLGVFLVGAIGFVFYKEFMPAPAQSKYQLDDEIIDVDVKHDSLPKNRTDVYKEKWAKERAMARKVENDDDFFGAGEEKDPYGEEVDSSKITKVDFTDGPVEFEEQKPQLKKVEPKTKVIVKYIEKPVEKVEQEQQVSVVPVKNEEEPVRRVAGFATNKKSTTSDVVAGTDANTVTLPVVIQDDVEVKTGSTVNLRTTEDATVNGKKIPKNTLLASKATVSQNTLTLRVTSLRAGNEIISKEFVAYSLDGSEGIILEGDVDQQIRENVADDVVSGVQRKVNIPILSDIPIKAGKKKLEDPAIPLSKGHQLILKAKKA